MSWLTLSIISVVTLAAANLLQRILMKDEASNAVAYSLVFQLTCALLVGLFALTQGFVLPPIQKLSLNFTLTTILYAAGSLLLFRALQTTEASKTTVLKSSSTLWTIVVALIFLGESLDILKIAGIGLILGSIVLVSLKKDIFSFNRGDLYILGTALCYGIAFANDAFILRQSDALSYTAIAFFLPGLLILAIKPRTVKDMGAFLKPWVQLRMLALTTLYSTSAITVYLAYQRGGTASQLASISQSVVILTVLLAAIFLGEREHLGRKFIAAALTTLGVLLLR